MDCGETGSIVSRPMQINIEWITGSMMNSERRDEMMEHVCRDAVEF